MAVLRGPDFVFEMANAAYERLVVGQQHPDGASGFALAVAWAGKAASVLVGRGEISRKTHGYRAKSWFRTGFDQLRKWVLYEPSRAIQAWSKIPTGRESVV